MRYGDYFFVSVVVVVVFSEVDAAGGLTMTVFVSDFSAGVTMVVFFSITLSGPGAAVLTRASHAIRRRGTRPRKRCVFMVVAGVVLMVDLEERRVSRGGITEDYLRVVVVVVVVCSMTGAGTTRLLRTMTLLATKVLPTWV
jgi:uncharacterized membrane protein YhaH (DUF805 family)